VASPPLPSLPAPRSPDQRLTLSPNSAIDSRAYVQTNLVSDIPGLAAHTDPNLRNAWGTSTGPGLPIWVSDSAAGVSTRYDGQGNPEPGPGSSQLVVHIPAPHSAGPDAVGAPDGSTTPPPVRAMAMSTSLRRPAS
jgi:hypothetical protein